MTSPFLAPTRSRNMALGRQKLSGGTIAYTVPGCWFNSRGTLATTSNVDYYSAWFNPSPIVIDQLALEITTAEASQNIRMGFYSATTDYQPQGAPLVDSGNISTATTGVKTYTPGTPLYVPHGRYVSVFNTSAAALSLGTYRGTSLGNSGLDTALGGSAPFWHWVVVIRTYAAFPTPGTAYDTAIAGSNPPQHAVVFRVSAP